MRVVWLPLALVAAAIVVTYSRIPPGRLYHVQDSGLSGGLGRALVFLSFPCAFVALGALAVAADRLGRRGRIAALAGALLCAVAAWPGVVDAGDLDAKWANAVPAVGVAIAVTLAFAAPGRFRRPPPVGIALVVVLAVVAAPWALADLGFSPDLHVWLTGQLRTQPGAPMPHPAVHPGHHHGMDGLLLAVCALLLLQHVAWLRGRVLRAVTAVWVSLLLAWGIANVVNDAWLEQVVKRGWTTAEVPDSTRPNVSWLWLAIVAVAAAVATATLRQGRREDALSR